MEKNKKLPRRLYKYRAFSDLSLVQIVADRLFYADPATFNDPLDTRPSIEIDLAVNELQEILSYFVERRIRAQMSSAAKTIEYRGLKTKRHIERYSRRQAEELLQDISYNATNPEYDENEDIEARILGSYIEDELLQQYSRGVVSLAERATCPLMWSHYGDQHRGICVGYSVPQSAFDSVHKVSYGGSRLVETSKVAAMIKGDDKARIEVDKAILLRKAADWRYEREWRLIGQRGLQGSPLELREVIFGTRCKGPVKYAVAMALEGRKPEVKLYEMSEVHGTFSLQKKPLKKDAELFSHFPLRSLAIREMFKPIRSAPSFIDD